MVTQTSMRWPRAVIALWLLLTAGLAVFAMHLPQDVKAGGFNDQHGRAFVGQQINEKAFHDAANELAIVLTAKEPFSQNDVARAASAARAIPGVSAVTDAHQSAALSSSDRKTQVLVVGFSSDNTSTQNQVKPLRDALTNTFKNSAVQSHVTGGPALDYDLNMQSSEDAQHAEVIAFPLLILVLLFVYRALVPTAITLTIAGICLAATQGIGDLLARTFDVSNMYITGASLIGLAVSVDYCLFVLKRHEENLRAGATPAVAISAASRTAGHAVRFGGTAVIAALCALYIPRNMVFNSIATAGIIVTLIAIAVTSTFVPAVAVVLGHRLFAGKLPGSANHQANGRESRVIAAALRKPAITAMILTCTLLGLAAPLASLSLRVPVASASILPAASDSRLGIEAMKKGLDARALFPTSVTVVGSSLDDVLHASASLDRFARSLPDSDRAISAGTSPHELSTAKEEVATHGQFSSGKTVLVSRYGNRYASRVVVTAQGMPDSSSAHHLTRQLQNEAEKFTGTEAYVTGATSQGDDFDRLVTRSIPWILLSVAAISFILLGFAFRSLWLPLLAIAMNGLVVSAAMGALTVLWKRVTGNDINSVTPVVLFAIIFGLSMDYMVLMAGRMKEEYQNLGDHKAAIAAGAARTSRLVTSAAIIMIAVFMSFLVAKISIVQELGTGLAIAVFCDAFLVRTLLMPAFLGAIGPRVWGSAPHPAKQESTA